ncbi:hypothetical protein [Spirosoma aerophilum]
MNWIAKLIIKLGDYLTSLSNQARIQIVVIGLLALGGGAIYKLTVNLQNLQKPLPSATPDQLIQPMQGLMKQTSAGVSQYRIERNRHLKALDSLRTHYPTKTNKPR